MRRWLWLTLPIAAIVATVAFILGARPLEDIASSAPPVEEIVVESVRLEPGVILLAVRADGSEPVRIAQILVDGAYRAFTQQPSGALPRLGRAVIAVPYPWVEGEAHHITLLTGTGATFDHTIEVAQATPTSTALGSIVLIGLLLGVVPVAAGLMAFPVMRTLGHTGIQFLLALTLGLLIFLFIDTLGEGLATASELVGRLHGDMLVWVVTAVTALGLLLVGRRGGVRPEGRQLAFFIALGIGLHNFGEGLAVGASLATGAAALATFLVIGFILHNVTEGIGIAAPLASARPRWPLFVGLAALAGLPAVAGVWGGSQAASPQFVVVSFAIGAGAILQVIIELVGFMISRDGPSRMASPSAFSGVAVGLLAMYATSLLV